VGPGRLPTNSWCPRRFWFIYYCECGLSVADGRIVKPVELQDQRLGRAIAFPGGFGYELHNGGDGADRVAFFDDSGKLLSSPDLVGTLRIGSLDLPMVEAESLTWC
jgi:hypothetical protein